MIGRLPTTLEVNGTKLNIRTDFRDCLLILQAFSDTELNDLEKQIILLKCLYKDFEKITEENYTEAVEKAIWFLNCGDTISKPYINKPLYSWEQDEQMIFSGINKVAGMEIRNIEYLHFWTFIGYFNEIGEGMFQSVVSIRYKKNHRKKLESYEREFYRDNKDIIDLKKKRTSSEMEQLQVLDELLGQ